MKDLDLFIMFFKTLQFYNGKDLPIEDIHPATYSFLGKTTTKPFNECIHVTLAFMFADSWSPYFNCAVHNQTLPEKDVPTDELDLYKVVKVGIDTIIKGEDLPLNIINEFIEDVELSSVEERTFEGFVVTTKAPRQFLSGMTKFNYIYGKQDGVDVIKLVSGDNDDVMGFKYGNTLYESVVISKRLGLSALTRLVTGYENIVKRDTTINTMHPHDVNIIEAIIKDNGTVAPEVTPILSWVIHFSENSWCSGLQQILNDIWKVKTLEKYEYGDATRTLISLLDGIDNGDKPDVKLLEQFFKDREKKDMKFPDYELTNKTTNDLIGDNTMFYFATGMVYGIEVDMLNVRINEENKILAFQHNDKIYEVKN